MSSDSLSDNEFVAKLTAHPKIKERLRALLSAIDDETDELMDSNAAEYHLIDEIMTPDDCQSDLPAAGREAGQVIDELKPHVEADELEEASAPVRRC